MSHPANPPAQRSPGARSAAEATDDAGTGDPTAQGGAGPARDGDRGAEIPRGDHRRACCELCSCDLDPANVIGLCAECVLVLRNRLADLPEPERWRPVVGWEADYLISDHGRVCRLLKQSRSGDYWAVTLRADDGRRKRSVRVHHLVALSFRGPRPDGHLVLHADDNNDNNSIGNLRYGTPSNNALDRWRNRRTG